MAQLGFELLYRFMWGSFFCLAFISRKESSERFLRIAFYILLGTSLAALYLLTQSQGLSQFRAIVSLSLLVVGAFLYTFLNPVFFRVLGFFLGLLAPLPILVQQPGLFALNFIFGSLVLGSVFSAQYLGHWFLNVAGLNIKELERVVKIMIFAFIAKSAENTLSLLHVPSLQDYDFFTLLIVISRILWGLVAPLFLSILVFKTVRMRSTQSATGILYAMSVMVIIGEAAAIFLLLNKGWYL